MNDYIYQNKLINKRQLKELLAWSFSKYDSMQASLLADELKYLGFKYATQAGISISIEDLKVPATKNEMLEKANKDILNAEKICLKGKITDVERFQKIIDTWSIASESLKDNVVAYFKTYDPLNSVYIMAFSGAREIYHKSVNLWACEALWLTLVVKLCVYQLKRIFVKG